eukprot:10617488-Lingulodinium_polyedra.AAC.1
MAPGDDAGVSFWAASGCSPAEAFSGPCFSDGSCARREFAELRRVAWAVAAVRDRRVVAVLKGPVWRALPQSSPTAEAVALAALAQVAAEDLTLT